MRRVAVMVLGVLSVLVLSLGVGADLLAGQATRASGVGDRPLPHPVRPPAEFQRAVTRGTRTNAGVPGGAYWQQWTAYHITTRLDPVAKRLNGSAAIRYHNRSPDTLPVVFLHLLQNLHAPGGVRNEPEEITGGVELQHVAAGGQTLAERRDARPGYRVSGTILAVRLPEPLEPEDSVEIAVDWAFTVPQSGAGRMGWSRDNFFYMAYWYPQMAVYDDVVGWQLDQYLGQSEFYTGFGRYDFTVEAPEGWVVLGTGALENPSEVLPERIARRLDAAGRSDTVVHVLTAADFGVGTATRRAAAGYLGWRFVADSVRDVAFSVTRESLWDAARTPVGDLNGDGRTEYARVDALYRQTAPKWRRAWRYAQHSIDFLSRWTGIPYPWPHMTAVEGGGIIGGGMEFPMMTLIGDYNGGSDSALYYVHAHELAHMWVPMIVGVDEKRYAWMDEGTTTFNENQARKEFFPGFNHDVPERDAYLWVAQRGLEGEMMRWSDYHYPGPAYGTASYSKPATVLATLRALLGDDVFLPAYRGYLRDWAFKHPKPWDFFNAFNARSGENLDWFWSTWYYETWTLDHAVVSVAGNATSARRTSIVIEDVGTAPMPARVTITLEDGTVLSREVPVDRWLSGARSAEIVVDTPSPVVRVEIDADRLFPDIDRSNDLWERR